MAKFGFEKVCSTLNFEDPMFFRHSVSDISEAQRAILDEAFVGASTTEVLAESKGLDPEQGFTASLLRHLGRTLIAFNYPTIYEKILTELSLKDDLDLKLAAVLGFTPSLLATVLLQRWGLAPGLLDALKEGPKFTEKENSIGVTLQRLCEVGEALARANHPELYPSASKDWDDARVAIEETLGKKGLSVVRKALRKNTQLITKVAPYLFKGGLVLDPEVKLWSHWDVTHLGINPFLGACTKEFRKPLHHFYERILSEKSPQDSVGILVKEILPLSGFQGGCVFTIDPASRLFIPQLKIRNVRLRVLEPVPYGNSGDPIAQAFETFETVQGTEFDEESETDIIYLAGVIGYSQRIGVLYLEVDERYYQKNDANMKAHFRTLCKALSDALRLK
jgi:hypothetical protein